MVYGTITIVTGDYKPTYNWGGHIVVFQSPCLSGKKSGPTIDYRVNKKNEQKTLELHFQDLPSCCASKVSVL
jgi:hypothetical protein